jgi:predicted glycogen debranching enzyme
MHEVWGKNMVLEQDKDAQYGPSIDDAWNLQIDHAICSDLQRCLDREWLVTNGIGGYAAGSLPGATTRSYHGLLVAALHPPVERTVLVAKFDEEITLPDGQVLQLGTNEYAGGVLSPSGYTYLESVTLEADIPRFLYRLNENLTLEKRIWMEYGQNTTYVQYVVHGMLSDEDSVVELAVLPFCLSRDHHNTTRGDPGWHFLVENHGNRCRVRASENAPTYQLIARPGATFTPTGLWYWHVFHRREHERGLADQEDLYQPGIFRLRMIPGRHATFVLSAEPDLPADFGGPRHESAVTNAFVRHRLRTKQLLAVADRRVNDLQQRDPVFARLILAADQFIVARPDYTAPQSLHLTPHRKTILAGYPWFADWGRDTMISLPGLLLHTGRYSEARGLLKAFASFVHEGLIPNRFPDSGETPEYNTVDATLWMFHALNRYLTVTGDYSLLKELFPVLSSIILWHIHGTAYGIYVDPVDGLLSSGVPGIQLTWMDAKISDWVVTPRHGKPVEVNALWYYALTCMESWAVRLSTDATQYSQLRTLVRKHFAARFWYEAGGYLYDVVDANGVAGQHDASLRPNQLFAAALTNDLVSDAQAASILQQVTAHLLTPLGLRSLSPTDPAYHGHFLGDRVWRDSSYHQGAVWPWLIGAYIDVHLRVHNDRDALVPLLQPLVEQLWQNCLGTIGELAEPEPPYAMNGCFAQAWSVAEMLRGWLLVRK